MRRQDERLQVTYREQPSLDIPYCELELIMEAAMVVLLFMLGVGCPEVKGFLSL